MRPMTAADSARLVALAALWGAAFIFLRVVAPVLGPAWTAELRVLLGGLALLVWFRVIGFDAVKHLVLCRIERRPPRLDMSVYPYLPHASVALTSARTYMDLLSGVTS